ncbi:MAG: protein kinase [Planctomycetota bacterium]
MSSTPEGDDQGSTSRLRDGLVRDGLWTDSDAAAEPLAIGKYRVVGELGRGGMGIVYRAWDNELRRDVAIKLLRVHDRKNPELASRMLREARTAAPLDHPGIVPVYESGEAGGTPYYVMAFVDGRTLATVLSADGLPPMRERARIVRDAAEAVAHAHAHNVVHRDLKPSNLMLDRDGRVHVLDFGLAKNLQDATQLTATGQVLGTAAYMPPEQVDGPAERVVPASDVYALGAVLYETLTGQPPFTGDSFTQIVVRSIARDPESPRLRDPKVPQDLETICLKALRKKPSERYPSARELADDLARFLRGEAILARPESLREKVVRWLRRHRAASIAAAVAAGALALAGVERWDASHRAEEQARVEQEYLQFLREIALTDLRVTLDLRRRGVVGDASMRLLERLERAARDTTRRAPGLAEPNYHLGRMHRALQRFPEALAEQDAALAKEPRFLPSLYERAVLKILLYRGRVALLRQDWQRRVGRDLADASSTPGLGGSVLPTEPSDDALAASDEPARRLIGGIQADLATLEDVKQGGALPDAVRLGVTGAVANSARGLYLLYCQDVKRQDEGRALLEEALRLDPTLEEAHEALADADLARGELEGAIEVYARASEADRGYVPFRLGSGRALTLRGQQVVRGGGDPVPSFEQAVAAYAEALDLAPEWPEAWIGRGRAHAEWGDWVGDQGQDPVPLLKLAVEDLDRALSLAPASVEARLARGWVRSVLGAQEADRGGDARPMYKLAVADYDAALAASGSANGYEGRGDVYRWWALEVKSRGEDPTSMFQAAIDDYTRALSLDVRSFGSWRRRGMVRMGAAIYRKTRGGDPFPAFPEALADLEKAKDLNPGHVGLWLDLGMLHATWGQMLSGLGEDPAGEFRAAEECLDRSEALNPGYGAVFEQRWVVAWAWAEFELRSGRDPSVQMDLARSRLTRALELSPNTYTLLEALGMLELLAGRDAERRGLDPVGSYWKAVDAFSDAIRKNARSTGAWMGRADARRRWAAVLARMGGDATEGFREALEDVDHALAIDIAWDEVWHAHGLVRRDRGAAAGDEADLRAAEVDFTRALSLNPGAVDTWMARGEVRALLAERLEDGALRDQARADVDKALQLAPHRSDAVALRASLR